MVTKKEAKKQIKQLISKYEKLSPKRLKTISEADTRRMFIMPFFRALGWDIDNIETENEVVEEETSISGRLDYSFRLNNITQFVLEAKAIPEDLNKDKWAKQAIDYGWNKGITWVVLSDFEGTKLFNSDWKVPSPRPNLDLDYKDYLKNFEDLWFLSKESFKGGELDRQAIKWGITARRVSVNERLAEDLLKWRKLLTSNLSQWNTNKNSGIIEESVQRILDRLIFIRVVEDRGIEDKILWQEYQKWETKGNKPQNFIKKLVPIFRKFDKKYNSNLFQKHACESLETEGDPFRKIIPDLYGSRESGVKYRFDAINADVLGNVYEQYLGYVQGREGSRSKRKKQGIFYTPTFIVDFIVQNSLGKLLQEKNLREIENIKVLDPACGSGSFLIKAFDVLDEKIKKERKHNTRREASLRKHNILKTNIYGVDLDPQAVEIAQLNLLLKALEPNFKLPMLTENIKVGNSLISDNKIAKKAFNWKSEFAGISKQGGFDVIIGNPPYIQLSMVQKLNKELKDYLVRRFKSSMGRLNTFGFFIKLSIDLLKEGGYLGFIIPNTITTQDYYEELRVMILENCAIKNIVTFEKLPFKHAVVENVIMILQKEHSKSKRLNSKVKINSMDEKLDFSQPKTIKQNVYLTFRKNIINLNIDKKALQLKKKIEKSTHPLGKSVDINQAIALKHDRSRYLSKRKHNKSYKPVLDGRDIGRYVIDWKNVFLKYDKNAIHSSKREEIFLTKEKLFFRRVGAELVAAYDNHQFYALNTLVVMNLKAKSKYSLKYYLALFNSKLFNYYFNTFLKSTKKVFSEIQARQVAQLPFKKIDFSQPNQKGIYLSLVKLVNKLLKLNESMKKIELKSDEWNKMKEKIKKLQEKIDQAVYKLYNLTAEEIEIVEKS